MRRTPTLCLAILLASCSSTSLVTRWHDPTAEQVRFSKVIALCITKDQEVRRSAEGQLCAEISSVECKPAYLSLPDSMLRNKDEAKALLAKEGVDGAVVVRVIDVREEVASVAPSYGPTFWGDYGRTWEASYYPGHYRADQILRLETSIYSVTRDQLLWVGTTDTVNHHSLKKTVEELVTAVRDQLKRDKLIPKR